MTWAERYGWAVLGGWLSLGCSFLYARPPAEEPSQPSPNHQRRVAERRAGCSIINPLYDFTWAGGGLMWVLVANRLEEDSRPQIFTGTGFTTDEKAPPTKDYSGMRYFGISQAAFFGASTLWGAYVQLRCEAAQKAHAEAVNQKTHDAQRGAFPNVVEGFTLGAGVQEAERACRSSHRDYAPDGSAASCTSPSAATGTSSARLIFRLGALSEVTIQQLVDRSKLGAAYEQTYAALVAKYGPPQVERAPLPSECAPDLAACLERGSAPKGATWYWSKGNLTLTPVLVQDRPALEHHYALSDTAD